MEILYGELIGLLFVASLVGAVAVFLWGLYDGSLSLQNRKRSRGEPINVDSFGVMSGDPVKALQDRAVLRGRLVTLEFRDHEFVRLLFIVEKRDLENTEIDNAQ